MVLVLYEKFSAPLKVWVFGIMGRGNSIPDDFHSVNKGCVIFCEGMCFFRSFTRVFFVVLPKLWGWVDISMRGDLKPVIVSNGISPRLHIFHRGSCFNLDSW